MPLNDVTNNCNEQVQFDSTICKGKSGNVDKVYVDENGTLLLNMTTWCAYPAWLNCVITHPP